MREASSLVLKVLGTYQFPPDALQSAIDNYRTDQIREMNFYKGRLGQPLPECLHRPEPLYVIDRAETGQRWIFMEDLGDSIPGPEQSVGDSLRAVANLAALHAQWWERADLLDRHDWLAPVTQDTTLWEGLAREQMASNLEEGRPASRPQASVHQRATGADSPARRRLEGHSLPGRVAAANSDTRRLRHAQLWVQGARRHGADGSRRLGPGGRRHARHGARPF